MPGIQQYIQNFSGDKHYSRQNSLNEDLANTGVNSDEKCKINDMASNTGEWTTEYCAYSGSSTAHPCISRGGNCYSSSYYTGRRYNNPATTSSNYMSFRCALYM